MEIIDYSHQYQPDFKRLNLEWLEKYNLTESHDLEILDDPSGTVIAGGGCIFLVKQNDEVIGTAGLWKENEEQYELIKMTVDPQFRGMGISKLLLDRCLQEGKKLNAKNHFFIF